MHDIPEAEARALLTTRRFCVDSGDWAPLKVPKGIVRMSCGLVDADGVGTGMYVQLDFKRSPVTGIAKYVFTLFRQTPHGPERVYQLDIEQMKVKPKNLHAMAHEHIGDLRVEGSVEWWSWSYDVILARFREQANIEFVPPPPHPEHFELVG